MGAKRAKPAEINRFREDTDLIERTKKLTNKQMADLMGVDPTYLSGCRAGSSKPGKEMIDKFDRTFGKDVDEIKYLKAIESPKINEPQQSDQEALLQLLNDNDRFLKNEIQMKSRATEIIAETNLLEAQNRQAMLRANEELVKSNRDMVAGIFGLLGKDKPAKG